MEVTDKEAIRLWYAGLGELFRQTRGGGSQKGFSMMKLHDSPGMRIFSYIIAGMALLVMSSCIFVPGVIIVMKFSGSLFLGMAALSWLIGIIGCYYAGRIFYNAYNLHKAMKAGADTDLSDSMRMKSMKRAVKWGIKKGHVIDNGSGTFSFLK